jgi:hypothetical protein
LHQCEIGAFVTANVSGGFTFLWHRSQQQDKGPKPSEYSIREKLKRCITVMILLSPAEYVLVKEITSIEKFQRRWFQFWHSIFTVMSRGASAGLVWTSQNLGRQSRILL